MAAGGGAGAGPFRDHFSAVAAGYAAYRPHYPDALFAYLASLPPRRDLAWDCACGNGQATLGLATHFTRVIGTDASPAQLEFATPHPRIEYRVGLAERSGLSQGSTDLVTVAQALHWIELEKFYAEVRRVLTPWGGAAGWVYPKAPLANPRRDGQLTTLYPPPPRPPSPPGPGLRGTGWPAPP